MILYFSFATVWLKKEIPLETEYQSTLADNARGVSHNPVSLTDRLNQTATTVFSFFGAIFPKDPLSDYLQNVISGQINYIIAIAKGGIKSDTISRLFPFWLLHLNDSLITLRLWIQRVSIFNY